MDYSKELHKIIKFDHDNSDSQLKSFIKDNKIQFVNNDLSLAINELYDISFPDQKDQKYKTHWKHFIKRYEGNDYGNWVYYPWLSRIVHFPEKDDLRRLRTSRNRNLITEDEQRKLYQSTALVAGLSVGSNVVEALVSQGISGKMILADMDILEPSNLNRIRSPYWHVGTHKVDAIRMKIAEIDPYVEVVGLREGIDESSLNQVINEHNPDILIDEMDSLAEKIKLREIAKDKKIPVVGAADNGYNTLLDIERYDVDAQLFNGSIPADILDQLVNGNFNREELGLIIGKYFVGANNISLRMYKSLAEVGRTLPSWPQLGGTAALAGTIVAYAVMQIILGSKIKSGRFIIGPDQHIGPLGTREETLELERYKRMLENFTS